MGAVVAVGGATVGATVGAAVGGTDVAVAGRAVGGRAVGDGVGVIVAGRAVGTVDVVAVAIDVTAAVAGTVAGTSETGVPITGVSSPRRHALSASNNSNMMTDRPLRDMTSLLSTDRIKYYASIRVGRARSVNGYTARDAIGIRIG
jgi:hypothetical protein